MSDRAKAEAAYPTLHLLIGGEWIDSDRRSTVEVTDPSTGRALGRLPVATTADVERAIEVATVGFEDWRKTSGVDRGRMLRAAADRIRSQGAILAELIALELGKPLPEAVREVETACEMFEWSAEEARRLYGRAIPARSTALRLTAVRSPIGPAGAVSGWNAPAITPARKLASALAAGCTIVLKPSEATPASAQLLVRALHDAGVPPGVVNMIFGDPPSTVGRMVDHPGLRVFSFTGATDVGRHLAARAALTLKRTVFELGGHAPALIFDDVDPETTARAAVAAKFRNAGQVCTSPTRFLIARPIFERFRDAFVAATDALRVDDPFVDGAQMGPLRNGRRLEAITALVGDARRCNASVIAGGQAIDRAGNWHQPTVLVDTPRDARAMMEEPFGPLALLAPFDTVDEAIAEANRLPFGLAAYAATGRLAIAERLAHDIQAGTLAINSWVASYPETPFGGVKDSGVGTEGGTEGVAAFLQTRLISVTA